MPAERAGGVFHRDLGAAVAVEDEVEHPLWQVFYGHVQRETVLLGEGAELHLRHLARVDIPAARADAALAQRRVGIGDELVDVDLVGETEPRAHGTRTVRIVE